MKSVLTSLLGLTLLFVSLSHAEEPKTRERVVPPYKTSIDFFDHLKGPARWELGQAAILYLRMWGQSTTFLWNDGQEVYRLDFPEFVQAAVLSEDSKALVLVVKKSTGSGSEFAALLRVQPDGDNVKIVRVLESGQKLFKGRWQLSELGAVSNDGARILAKFAVEESTSADMVYRWHTVNLTHRKILSEGLTMEDAKKRLNE